MVRTKEYLTKYFSKETIDREIDRVKRAENGKSLFEMQAWETDDYVVSILAYAGVSYEKKEINGMIHFIKVG